VGKWIVGITTRIPTSKVCIFLLLLKFFFFQLRALAHHQTLMKSCLTTWRWKTTFVVATANSTNSYKFFNFEEMEKGVGHLMDPIICVWDILQTMQSIPTLFKTLTTYFLKEFKKMASLVILTITSNADSYSCCSSTKVEWYTMTFRVHSRYKTQPCLMFSCGIR